MKVINSARSCSRMNSPNEKHYILTFIHITHTLDLRSTGFFSVEVCFKSHNHDSCVPTKYFGPQKYIIPAIETLARILYKLHRSQVVP